MTFQKLQDGKTSKVELADTGEAYAQALDVFAFHEKAAIIDMALQINKGYTVNVRDRRRTIIFQLKTVSL